MPRPNCSICGDPKTILNTVENETWICANCDQYPWMITAMTEKEVMDRDALASRKARRE